MIFENFVVSTSFGKNITGFQIILVPAPYYSWAPVDRYFSLGITFFGYWVEVFLIWDDVL